MKPLDLDADLVELSPVVLSSHASIPLREMAYRADAWTPAETDRLRDLFASDMALVDIAASIGRSRAAIAERIFHMGLRRNSLRPWTELDDEELTRRYGENATAAIASDLGRSCAAVYARASLLGLSEGNPPLWTAWEDAQLVEGYRRGVPVRQIATLIGRSMGGVSSRACARGLVHANQPPGWSPSETRRALELGEAGHRYARIVEILVSEGFPCRSSRSFGLAVRKLGYGRGWGRPWTAEEDALLTQAYATGTSLTPLRQQLGRTAGSLRHRAEYLKLRGSHAMRNGWRGGPDWTEAEEQRLRDEYGKIPTTSLAAKFGRSKAAITSRANSLGLVHGYIRPFSDEENRALGIAYRTGISIADLAVALDRKAMSVSKYASNHGYHFGRRPRRAVTLAQILDPEPVAAAQAQ
ncbi:hypothetical protein H5V43_21955 (plasmid) [Sphingobium fuliginis]|jgi:hypothetical protein|uniref:Uncharacterized protein n=1 Tax=Sphingobium fuliginis (strain ATCC 27551) TaxID=336203 RepID=A0A7M2GPT4_SPHSA|nr:MULTISPECIES: hypothetical protein [Sphingobium]QOT74538.1 hypothetical protein H5V43_21955 [Sphingobium fuliginis]